MKLYLSSYRLGNNSEKLKSLVGKARARVAVSVNALDGIPVDQRTEVLEREFADMKSLGFLPEELDLRDYFGKPGILEKLTLYDLIWFSGGNAFLLVKAFRQSGFDQVLEQLVKQNKLVYAGYSAALSAISPTLHGAELVDDKDEAAAGYGTEVIWDGYGLIDFYPIVHYKSVHPESHLVEKELAYVKAQGRKYKTLRDGDVVIVDN